jgi:hypothetical protein
MLDLSHRLELYFAAPDIEQVSYWRWTETGSGAQQVFQVPDGATRLYFGIPDSRTSSTGGTPGAYNDNGGSHTAIFNVVPEASTASLLVIGALMLSRRRLTCAQ